MAEAEFQDLIIIKRHHAVEHDSVHGGVWKIAFADFMTAMMCFFLVMWLINAANEDTRQAVASYFNPVRLADLNRKGLADPHLSDQTTPTEGEKTLENTKASESSSGETAAPPSREALFKDPYRVLAEIAGEGEGAGAALMKEALSADAPSSGKETAFRDPFEPDMKETLLAPAAPEPATQEDAAPSNKPVAGEKAPPSEEQAADMQGAAPPVVNEEALVSEPQTPPRSESGPVPISRPPGAPSQSAELIESNAPGPAGQSLLAQINDAVEHEGTTASKPAVAVEQTGEGLVISLTDEVSFGMFAIGSATPQPETVRIMERIAGILKERKGSIIIRGHTDGRPFHTPDYDNWRLSVDRAQIAYYMLTRGGLDKSRVAAIEGYADRKLKLPEDPDAAQNRRIEILLKEDGS